MQTLAMEPPCCVLKRQLSCKVNRIEGINMQTAVTQLTIPTEFFSPSHSL